ncbi:MAG: YlmC/YmxH family sporulation protein [Firmicutes bacterium]|jgi:YlmC/YmxH family sporulation protein|nr:YlmC/YmxH family sporulation protein [Bacillota bacterium]NBI62046.1 YlmC/YmxH family sporulation protein [Clostridiales bacterium]
MRLSEIGSKEIVDLSKGSSHGQLWDTELLFEKKDGAIRAVLIPSYHSKGPFKHASEEWIKLPWSNIVKIGEDMIIFQSADLD